MELIVLNIGYDLGVLSPEIFGNDTGNGTVYHLYDGTSLDLINFLFRRKVIER
jgi:hypothetical protein